MRQRRRRSPFVPVCPFRPCLEILEDRLAPALFTVTSAADDLTTPGTLRQAIMMSNATPGPNTIQFAIGTGPQTIALNSNLPDLTQAVTIDGTSQPGSGGAPVITLTGNVGTGLGVDADH